NLAQRAYRGPIDKADVDQIMAHAARVKQRGDPFEEQVAVAIQALLVSPRFLFRIERDPARKTKAVAAAADSYYLNDYELASRLSYFLWSSMPDEALIQAASQGT